MSSSRDVESPDRRGRLRPSAICIGDHGNVMAFGLIEDTCWRLFRSPFLQVPCGQGMAAAVSTDIVIRRTVSQLLLLRHRGGARDYQRYPNLLHDYAETRPRGCCRRLASMLVLSTA